VGITIDFDPLSVAGAPQQMNPNWPWKVGVHDISGDLSVIPPEGLNFKLAMISLTFERWPVSELNHSRF
jgi:hypothetical protein